MVIIFEMGNEFWIESIVLPRVSIAGGALNVTDQALERAGFFLGCALSLDNNGINSVGITTQECIVRNTDDSDVIYGQAMNTIRIVRANNAAGAILSGVKVLIFMRGLAK